MMHTIMTIAAKCQKILFGIVSPLGPRFNVMNLQMPVAAAELAGELVPPEDLDHDLLLAPGPPHWVRVLVILAVSHA